jgi:pyoverdine/dityrosine biosynthesis protein Dit1
MSELRTRVRILEEAVRRMAERGLYPGLLEEAARGADCSLARARIFFARDQDLVVALQERLAAEFEERLTELPEGTVAERFDAAMRMRLEQIGPYRRALARLLAVLLDPDSEHGVLGQHTDTVRERVGAVFESVVLGASDSPAPPAAELLARLLYAGHLGLILLATQDRSEGLVSTFNALALARRVLAFVPLLGAVPLPEQLLGPWLLPPADPAFTEVAERVLRALFRHRRLLPESGDCAERPCSRCLISHLARTRRFVAAGLPVHLVLPAFPAKSPSHQKVLGPLPDRGEELAIEYLKNVCAEVRAVYPPGARITICSDGRVFSDLVGVSDDDVTAYGQAVTALIARAGAEDCLSTFCTEDLFDLGSHEAVRRHLCDHYAEPLSVVEERARIHPSHRAMWNGMQRFLFEDRLGLECEQSKSRTQLRKECATLAHGVIQRSNAWTRVVSDCFPTALRLSIHPQPPHSTKIGIRLLETDDVWLTPWHGVVVERAGCSTLMPRHQAEALGATLVEREGRPSHYVVEGGSP